MGEIFFIKKNKRAYTFIRHLRTTMTWVVEYFDGGFFEMEEWQAEKRWVYLQYVHKGFS